MKIFTVLILAFAVVARAAGTPLHEAASKGDIEAITVLLNTGAYLNARDGFGFTPLRLAAQDGHTEVVTALLDAGADPNTRDNDGFTPFTRPRIDGRPEPVTAPDSHCPPSRRGRKAVTVYLDDAAHRQLRLLALEQGISAQTIVAGAINDLFQKHGKAHIAG